MTTNSFQIVMLTISIVCCFSFSALSQKSNFLPQQVEITNKVLISSILKYKKNLTNHDIFIVSQREQIDSTILYISSINSVYRLSKNIPLIYTQVDDQYILFYSGLEHLVEINDRNKNTFLSLFRNILNNDVLPDNATRDPKSFGSGYDPIQVILVLKNNKIVYENFKKGFGSTGMPYFNQ